MGIDANRELLRYAVFVEFDSSESAQFIFELLNGRKTINVYFAKEYPTKYVSIRSKFNKQHLLRLYGRFGRVENVTLCGQSFIVRFRNEAEASSAILNTAGRRLTVIDDININDLDTNTKKTSSVIDIIFANDIENIQLSKNIQNKIFQMESDLDHIENILAVEWTPSEPEIKKQKRLKLQKQYEPPNMSMIERYNAMLQDANDRIKAHKKEIEILQEVASDKAALKHLRKYIDPKGPSIETLNNEIDPEKLENKKLCQMIKKWKEKCVAFDEELEKSK